MGRLARFEDYRLIGARDTMVFYDCDQPDQLAELERLVLSQRLFERNLLQTFAPDDELEAANRGFRPSTSR